MTWLARLASAIRKIRAAHLVQGLGVIVFIQGVLEVFVFVPYLARELGPKIRRTHNLFLASLQIRDSPITLCNAVSAPSAERGTLSLCDKTFKKAPSISLIAL